jgi:hypothetical protein
MRVNTARRLEPEDREQKKDPNPTSTVPVCVQCGERIIDQNRAVGFGLLCKDCIEYSQPVKVSG